MSDFHKEWQHAISILRHGFSDVITFNATIAACDQHWQKGLQLLLEMKETKMQGLLEMQPERQVVFDVVCLHSCDQAIHESRFSLCFQFVTSPEFPPFTVPLNQPRNSYQLHLCHLTILAKFLAFVGRSNLFEDMSIVVLK